MSLNEPRVTGWQRTLSDWIAVDVVLAWALAGAVYLLTVVDVPTGIRFGLVAPAVFLLPGYVLVAASYPRRAAQATGVGPFAIDVVDRVGVRERAALSFGLSLALLPLLGIAIGISPWTFSETAAVRAFVGFVAVVGLLAALRRRRVAPEDRFRLPFATWSAEARDSVASGSGTDRLLNVAVIVAALLALATVGYALAVPPGGEVYTNFAVLTQEGDELVSGGYQSALSSGEPAELVTAVENHEGESVAYTVVVTEASVNQFGRTTGEVELQRFGETVEPGERWTRAHEVVPRQPGQDVRLNYYLYRGTAPDDPDASSAAHHLYLWTGAGDGGSG